MLSTPRQRTGERSGENLAQPRTPGVEWKPPFLVSQTLSRSVEEPASPEALSILEIGSGTSPLKRFHPNVLTSDVLELDYLDLVFDCHDIDKLVRIEDNSLDVITLTNVLHHLESPIDFLNAAAGKLKPGGKVIATEPYFSVLSRFIFKYLHHEPVGFTISEPELNEVEGPLASANIALPWLIFCRRRDWLERLNENYDVHGLSRSPF